MADPMRPASASDLGIDTVNVVGKRDGGLADELLDALRTQEEERKKKLMRMGSMTSLAAQSLLGNATGGFGG